MPDPHEVNSMRVKCSACGNSFFVRNGHGGEFDPNYCCYCGIKFEERDPKSLNEPDDEDRDEAERQ